MVDISGNGIAFNTNLVLAMETDQSGQLCFILNGTSLEIPGTFVRSTPKITGLYTCSFKLNPDRKSDRTIARFIYQRQVEIIQQLKDGLVVESE
jgi:hypothetical protein